MADKFILDEGTPSERLARSRAELQRLFTPEKEVHRLAPDGQTRSEFPRSAIMKAITTHGGSTGLALAAVALFAAKPRLAARLLRFLPLNAITKVVIAKFIDAQGARK